MHDVNKILAYLPDRGDDDRRLIARAHAMLQEKNVLAPQYVKVAETLAKLHMDTPTIVSGLLYDVLGKNILSESELQDAFGDEVSFLVQGVTELTRYRYQGLDRHKESLRKLLLAVSEDLRVLIVKLTERVHRFESLHEETEDKRLRVALETLEIYAPIANRLGMGQMKGDLEDHAFPYVYPEEYEMTKKLFNERSKETEKRGKKMYRSVQKTLAKAGIRPITTDYRVKHLYSLYRKLHRYDMDIEKIYDISALRIIVPTIEECYRVLGILHGTWKPLPGRIKDYIATPKQNGYQSLHTTVEAGDGGVIEIQIRTEKMHEEAEFGIASHFFYKEFGSSRKELSRGKKFSWIREIALWQKKITSKSGMHEYQSGYGAKNFRHDFFKDRVFVFTPKRDVIDLPRKATAIDFAYAIHSEVGNHMSGAKINGKLTALETPIQSGDTVEIVTKKGGAPSSKWLGHAITPLAKKHIRGAASSQS